MAKFKLLSVNETHAKFLRQNTRKDFIPTRYENSIWISWVDTMKFSQIKLHSERSFIKGAYIILPEVFQ
jgi:hypothetical protein